MSNKENVLVSVAVFLLAIFIFWYGGVDFFRRGITEAGYLVISMYAGVSCYMYTRI